MDATNAEIYENVLNRFLPVLMQIRSEGGRTPQVCFMLNTDIDEICFEDGKVAGVKKDGVVTKSKMVVCSPSYVISAGLKGSLLKIDRVKLVG